MLIVLNTLHIIYTSEICTEKLIAVNVSLDNAN